MNLETVTAKIDASGEIPTIGPIASEIVRLVNQPDADARSVGRLVQRDPAITARVLRVANAPYYGFSGQVGSVERAIALLGMAEIRNISLSVSVISDFSKTLGSGPFNWERFWEHSSGCALIAQEIVKLLRLGTGGDEFVAGLLHDVGKILFGHHFPREFEAVLQLAADERIGMEEAEARIFGADHASLGAWVASRWAFPPAVRGAIADHHHPERAEGAALLPAVVHLADLLAKAKCIGFGGDALAVCITDDPAWAILAAARPDLPDLDLERITFALDREVDAARELLKNARGA